MQIVGEIKTAVLPLSASIGIGYYKLSADKIRELLPFDISGLRTARNVNYNDGFTNLLYSTNKCHYNDFSFTIGFNKTGSHKKNSLVFDAGIEGMAYYSLSQYYHLGVNRY